MRVSPWIGMLLTTLVSGRATAPSRSPFIANDGLPNHESPAQSDGSSGNGSAAVAEPVPPQERNPSSPFYRQKGTDDWYFDFVIGVEMEPDYIGSDDYDFEPTLNARVLFKDKWNNRHSFQPFEWISAIDLSEDVVLNVKFEFEEGRENENDALEGLDDIDDTLELEATLAYRIGAFTLAAVAQPDLLSKGKGFVGFVAATYDATCWDDRLRIGAALDVSFANQRHMDTEFGISRAEADRTSYPHYQPGGGWKSSTAGAEFEYSFTDRLSLFASGEIEYYFSKAADSPLIEDEGSGVGFARPLAAWVIATTNLVENAIAHTTEGAIEVDVSSERIEVRDTGGGIPAELRERLTEPWIRGDRKEGFGLGLSIVNCIVRRVGWRLEIESDVGVGTVVRLTPE